MWKAFFRQNDYWPYSYVAHNFPKRDNEEARSLRMATKMSRLQLFLISFMCSLLLQVTALSSLSTQSSLLPVFAPVIAKHHPRISWTVQTCKFPLAFSVMGKDHIRISIRSGRHGRYSIRWSCSGSCHGLRPYATRKMLKGSPQSGDRGFVPRRGTNLVLIVQGKRKLSSAPDIAMREPGSP